MVHTLDPDEVIMGTAAGPGIYVSPVGTIIPADVGAPATPWKLLGYLSEDGPKLGQSMDTDSLMAWQATSPIKTFLLKKEYTIDLELLQVNEQTMAMYFNQAEPTPAGGGDWEMELRDDVAPREYAVTIVVQDEAERLTFYFSRVTISNVGDYEINKKSASAMPITLTSGSKDGVVGKVIRDTGPIPGAVPITGVGVVSGDVFPLIPANATPPKNLAALQGHAIIGDSGSSQPGSTFTSGQYLVLGDGSKAHWTGSAWLTDAAS